MKKKIVIITSVVVLLVAAYLKFDYSYAKYQREHREVPIPTGTVQYFDMETEKAIKIFSAKSNSLDPLNDADKEYLKDYFGKYVNNPRLDEEQDRTCTDVMLLDVFYESYIENKDGTKKKEIKEANESIESFFSILKRLQNTQ